MTVIAKGSAGFIGSNFLVITFIKDRPGHDLRYAIDATKIECDLGWKLLETFDTGMRKTVAWYLHNFDWLKHIQSKKQYN